jgi:hypothetical protein
MPKEGCLFQHLSKKQLADGLEDGFVLKDQFSALFRVVSYERMGENDD